MGIIVAVPGTAAVDPGLSFAEVIDGGHAAEFSAETVVAADHVVVVVCPAVISRQGAFGGDAASGAFAQSKGVNVDKLFITYLKLCAILLLCYIHTVQISLKILFHN